MESDGSLPLPSVCRTCDARFINELLRIQHVRHCHPESLQYPCVMCGIKCESQDALTRHVLNKHTRKKKKESETLSAATLSKGTAKLPTAKKSCLVNMQKNASKTVSKVSPQWRARVEMACMRYAMVHGKHKAQLRYAQLEPGCRIGWRRLTEILSMHKHDKTGKKAAYLYKRGRKGGKKDVQLSKLAIPADIKSDCGKFGVTYGIDDAQWEFTLQYPNYIFSYASVRNWCEAERMKLEKDGNLEKPFDEEFVSSLNEAVLNTKSLSISEAEKTIKNKVQNYNQEIDEDKKAIDVDNAVEEWLHVINSQMAEKKKVPIVHCACGNVYKTDKELAKHKPKCWLPDFKSEAQVRSQRSCRNKATPSECETISDSESGSSVVEETYSNAFKCSDCEYSTPQEFRYKRHIKSCHKKRLLSEKLISNKSVRDCDQANNHSELLTFKNCKKCSFKHITIEGLREHYRVVHNSHYTDNGQEISLLCTKCNDTFLTYAGLREHICGERQITVKYERIKPRIPSSIMLGTNSSIVFLCPRCVTRFDTIQELKEHYSAKSCAKSKLYA